MHYLEKSIQLFNILAIPSILIILAIPASYRPYMVAKYMSEIARTFRFSSFVSIPYITDRQPKRF